MKQYFQKGKLLVAASLLCTSLLFSCKDDDPVMPAATTITAAVVADPEFSLLEQAVVRAGLQNTLGGTGPFTVFAPDNAAFAASGISSATINTLSTDDLSDILLYHTLGARVASADVPAGPNAKVVTAGGDSVFVTKNASGVYVNGIKVLQADINASNGVIHRLSRVLMPPMGNIVETAQMPGSGLDSLVKAIVRAGTAPGGDASLIPALQSGTLTVFAPSNAAFTQLLTALSLTNINEIPVATLIAVLKYHVVPGRAFSSDLMNGQVMMLAGGNTTVNLTNGSTGGPTITGNSNAGARANITATNIVARNGVVHVIDRVLLP